MTARNRIHVVPAIYLAVCCISCTAPQGTEPASSTPAPAEAPVPVQAPDPETLITNVEPGDADAPAASPSGSGDLVNPATLTTANNTFGFDIYDQLRAQPGNLFFSPHSIATALTMTYAGARGNTAGQMATVLHLPPGDVHAAYQSLNAGLRPATDDFELRIANRLWAHYELALLDSFRDVTKQHYDAEVGSVDFVTATEPARQAINDWVEDATNGKIAGLLPIGAIDPLTRLVLTNAIYFKGTWLRQFDPAQTQDAIFYGSSETRVPLMSQRGTFAYTETSDYQVLRLPYVGEALSMIVLLPRDRGGLATLEAELTAMTLKERVSRLQMVEVDVWLPRFSTSSHFGLKRMLSTLGMVDAFIPSRADLSGIAGQRGLFISEAIHKAFVEVNEEGSEAAAATAVVVGIESVPQTVLFRADHPFVFMIVDDRSGAILFLGRLVDPE